VTGKETGEVAFLAFLIALVFALAVSLGDQVEPAIEPWSPQTVAPPITTEVNRG
jgi:hypothetical protein